MNPAELNSMIQLGATTASLVGAVRQKQKADRLAVVDGAIHELDRATEIVESAYNTVSQGQPINAYAVAERAQNALDAVQNALTSLRAAGYSGLGFSMAPLAPAFGMQAAGPGMAAAQMPQGATAHAASLAARALAPQLQAMRSQLRGARQQLSRIRTQVAQESTAMFNPMAGLGALGIVPNGEHGYPQPIAEGAPAPVPVQAPQALPVAFSQPAPRQVAWGAPAPRPVEAPQARAVRVSYMPGMGAMPFPNLAPPPGPVPGPNPAPPGPVPPNANVVPMPGPQLGPVPGSNFALPNIPAANWPVAPNAAGGGLPKPPKPKPVASAPTLPVSWQRPPDMFPGQRIVEYGMAIGGFYHGYNRNNKSLGWGLLWALPGLIGLIPGGIAMAVAVSNGFGKPASAVKSPQP